jgi:hypothetical protein
MPALRRDDPARRGDPRDRRPVAPSLAYPRNGIPDRRRPYSYGGSGGDELTGWWDHAGLPVAPTRALSPLALLDVCEAIDGPDPVWYLELAEGF